MTDCMPNPAPEVSAAITELRALTTCQCRPEYALKDGHESECRTLWAEDVDTVAAELTYRAVRIADLERDLADARSTIGALNRKLAGGR
jgi:hypothetical protein